MPRRRFALFTLPIAALLGACEGLFTGDEVARIGLQPGADGGYAPVKLTLAPDMNPVSLNLHAEFTTDVTQAGRWNTYRATLTKDGAMVFTREFSINYPGTVESSPAQGSVAHVMMIVDIVAAGEHELAIVPVKPVEVVLNAPQAVARSKVQRPPK